MRRHFHEKAHRHSHCAFNPGPLRRADTRGRDGERRSRGCPLAFHENAGAQQCGRPFPHAGYGAKTKAFLAGGRLAFWPSPSREAGGTTHGDADTRAKPDTPAQKAIRSLRAERKPSAD